MFIADKNLVVVYKGYCDMTGSRANDYTVNNMYCARNGCRSTNEAFIWWNSLMGEITLYGSTHVWARGLNTASYPSLIHHGQNLVAIIFTVPYITLIIILGLFYRYIHVKV